MSYKINKKAQVGKALQDSFASFAIIILLIAFLLIVLSFSITNQKAIDYTLQKNKEVTESSIILEQILNSKIELMEDNLISDQITNSASKQITFFELLILHEFSPEEKIYSQKIEEQINIIKEIYPNFKLSKIENFNDEEYFPEKMILIPSLSSNNKVVYEISI